MSDSRSRAIASELAKSAVVAQVTAPTQGLSPAERRVGEAEARIWCSSLEPAVRDLARDLLDERAANASLTAEVERLTKERLTCDLASYCALDAQTGMLAELTRLRSAEADNEVLSRINLRLTAEVERLRGIAQQAIWMLNEWDESMSSYQQGTSDGATAKELAARLAALSLPTTAPEAGTCPECNGPVYHREGKPGEFDHECSAPPAPEATE